MELKLMLRQLETNKIKQLSKSELDSLIMDLLGNIGSIDPELRDHLIYPTFMRLINENVLSDDQFQHILDTCLDEHHLFYRLGEENTDSVFTRSFSSLVITGIVYKDRQAEVLSEEKLRYVFNRSMLYLQNERDTRGYVIEKGWAHSIAHGADLLDSIVRHPKFDDEDSKDILLTIHNCLFKEATYIDDEDERLIFVIEALIARNIDEKTLEKWSLHLFNDLELIYRNEGFSNKYFRTKFNIVNFFKSLYFRLGYNNQLSHVRNLLNNTLKKLHQKVYLS